MVGLCVASFFPFLFSGPMVRAQDAASPAPPAANSSTSSTSSTANTRTEQTLVVRGEEVQSAYGAPPALSRSRFSNLVNAYVLPPYAVYAALIYQGDALRFNRPDHSFTEEVELGLPYRFGVAVENQVEAFRGTTQERSFSIEGRYAFADWDKIPLNPTIFAEYKFGIGDILHDEGPPAPAGKGDAQAFLNEHNPLPDAVEVRLLLAETFGEFEWALNGFFEQETSGDRGREYGFAQSALVPIILPRERLKVGVEMQFTTFTDKGIRNDPSYRFIIGPSIAWKPSKNTRFDVSPLFGTTDDSPRASVFAVFSYVFCGSEGTEAEAPASTRNR
ncbi:MAG: hypothetical protein H0X34_20070 [Chthoniobacterales bacterium]|nr:hypothetical protein [Chthoniobacterales bacterium]